MSAWRPLWELLFWCPIFKSDRCNSFDDLAPVSFFYGCLIIKWGTETIRPHGRVPIQQIHQWPPGGHLNIKTPSYQHRNSHYKDKTVSLPSYLYNGNTHIWKDHLYIETGPRGHVPLKAKNDYKSLFTEKITSKKIQLKPTTWFD